MTSGLALIVGCARSGTSILGELVATHPDVRYVFEAHAAWEIAGTGENESHRLTERHADVATVERIRAWFAGESGDHRWLVEKNPRNALRIPFVRAVFPEARIIHIVRDGRDVACSMLPGIGGEHWKHLKPPSWKELFTRHEGVVRCALAWQAVLDIALADLASARHHSVRYEDLVQRPLDTARGVLAHLELDLTPEGVEFCRRISDSTRASYHAQHQVKWSREDHEVRVGRWRERARSHPGEMAEVESLLRPSLDRLGYA